MKKRKMSAKQKKALAEGRKKLKVKHLHKHHAAKKQHVSKRRKHAVSRKVEYRPIIINGGSEVMDKRKKKVHHVKHVVYGKKRRHHRRMGAFGLPASTGDLVLNGISAIAGAVAASAVSAQVPGVTSQYRPFLPIVVGAIAVVMAKGNAMLKYAGVGAIAAGGISAAQKFAPTIKLLTVNNPTLKGMDMPRPKVPAMNAPARLGIPQLMAGYRTPASIS
jgi:hypothetical protein